MNQERTLKKEILKMVAGFRRFRERFFEESSLYSRLASNGQSPKTLMIACSDSRVDPAILFSSSPGEIFVVRNVANLVPPAEDAHDGFHGVSAAIEFAVVNLQVENIMVLGHRQCGGIRALFQPGNVRERGFVARWMSIAHEAKEKVLSRLPQGDVDTLCRECEKESLVTSLKNLRTFYFIDDAIKNRGLEIFGVYFDLEDGRLWYYDENAGQFDELTIK